jgi:NAD(P)-dependent dehydrogenase (short-subunit alcohol dehydrogenase family)
MERPSPGQPLVGQVALVVGGSGGIGGAIAVALAAAGADVAVTYRSGAGRAQAVVEQVAAQERRAVALEADLRERAAVDRAVAAALAALGRIDVLVTAVGAAARGALNAFAKSLAREVARDNITVNVVCPGPTRTDRFEQGLLKEGDAHVWERVLQSVPLKRVAEPREVASLVVYLASPDGGYMTGQALSVSGGLTMV